VHCIGNSPVYSWQYNAVLAMLAVLHNASYNALFFR
jgi:hypothetical protein